jgi:GDP-L-fucose synthase
MRVLLTGARGMLGSSIVRSWQQHRPQDELILWGSGDVDLRDRTATIAQLSVVQPDAVIHAAAKVAGIAQKIAHPTEFLLENLLLDTSLISASLQLEIPEFLYVGSAAVYPEVYRQPFLETDLLAAPLEKANEGYAIAKLSGIKLCEYISQEYGFAYRAAIPSNLYGPNENYSTANGHLIAATIAKVAQAKASNTPYVSIWGDGSARREFTFSDDLSSWLVGQVGNLAAWPQILNLGYGKDYSISEYYETAREVIGYQGSFEYDLTKPTGMQERILDSSLAKTLGWNPTTSLFDGITASFASYQKQEGFKS